VTSTTSLTDAESVSPDDAEQETTFLAFFPPIQSALRIHGSGDGMRITLEIPEDQMPGAIALIGWRQEVLRVTIECLPRRTRDDG